MSRIHDFGRDGCDSPIVILLKRLMRRSCFIRLTCFHSIGSYFSVKQSEIGKEKSGCLFKRMRYQSYVLLLIGAVNALNIRDGNVGNCVGVKSCRPRCVTFRLDRQERCDAVGGIFNLVSQLNPWDTKRFRTLNCKPSNTCVNDKCGHDLSGDLTIAIGEQGYSGGTFFTNVELLANDDTFTFCSIYPCTKDECALPEQMVSFTNF